MTSSFTITVIGTGNVASHLVPWLEGAGAKVSQANPHTLEGLHPQTDICIVSVTDSAIPAVAASADKALANPDAIIAHTSGTTPLSALSDLSHATGVLYPMQTFTKGRKLDYAHIPLFHEGSDPEAAKRLEELAGAMTDHARHVDSDTRAHIHLGAVFACNYLNYMMLLAERTIAPLGLDTYRPLIEETIAKALEMGPRDAQTGPARRGDINTLWAHMHLLQAHPHTGRVYRLLSQQILNLYKDCQP